MAELFGRQLGFNPITNMKQAGSLVRNVGYEAAREIGSRIGNNNSYDIRNPFSGAYRTPNQHVEAVAPQGGFNPVINVDPVGGANDSGYYGSGSGSGSGSGGYSKEDLAYLDSQQAVLDRQYGRTDTTLRDALDAVLQNYNKELSGANLTRSRNLEDFDDKTEISEQGRARELGKVDTSARMLANSLRQRLGLASGSGSSAYQVSAPDAVRRQATEQRGDVLSDYSANFQELDKNKKRSEEDYNSLLEELGKQRAQREGGVVSDIESQRNSIRENKARVAGEKAKLLDGGYNAVRQAMSPYEAQIAQGEGLLDSIYSKYAAKYNVTPIAERKTNLRDYATDKVAVRDQQATGTEDPYAPYKRYTEDEEEKALVQKGLNNVLA